jgi:hypothetical protein
LAAVRGKHSLLAEIKEGDLKMDVALCRALPLRIETSRRTLPTLSGGALDPPL